MSGVFHRFRVGVPDARPAFKALGDGHGHPEFRAAVVHGIKLGSIGHEGWGAEARFKNDASATQRLYAALHFLNGLSYASRRIHRTEGYQTFGIGPAA